MSTFSTFKGAAVVALASATLSSARALDKRQSYSFDAVCDASRTPDWNGCQSAFDQINAQANSDPNYQWTFGGSANCVVFDGDNCAVSICSLDNYKPVPQFLVVDATDTLISDCKYAGAGGKSTDKDGSMFVSAYASDQNPTKMKRDNTWTEAYRIENAAPENFKQQVLSALPGGSSWELTTEQSQTNRVEASVSLSEDFFTIFSSSQSITYGYEKTVSTSTTQTINNNCANDQTGTLFWYPLFTQHHGGFSEGPSPVDIYVPVSEGDDGAVGKYQVVCSG
ncbi:hypothetical protein D6C77_00067 [Aureobasidium pullulans]|uniref:Isoamyl alcohol oxidase n=1 Tax=Aureobasidium pullulans TaxID=5580 RepID=A0AB38M9X9_AURPU|nr:hypothetical protein D6C94_01225 [Aureobasidium pullulans]TIA66438.1 hypothetical protein D6C77_00067 [Aureobasidium pullulans]